MRRNAARVVLSALAIWLAISGATIAQSVTSSAPTQQGPAVDFNFASGSYYQTGQACAGNITGCITVSRASTRLCQFASGNWISVGNNTPCITDLGLTLFESRTNSIRNSTMQGAVAGTPGTLPTNWGVMNSHALTTNVIGTGTENGLSYIDLQIVGTPNATDVWRLGFDTTTGIAAANNQTWTPSVFVRQSGGSLTNVGQIAVGYFALNSSQSILAGGGASAGVSLTSAYQQLQVSAATTDATTADVQPYLNVGITSGQAISVTLRIEMPQMEGTNVTFAGPPIPTSGSATTAAADAVTLTNVPNFGSSYSLFASGIPNSPAASSNNQIIVQTDANTATDRVQINRHNTNATSEAVFVGGNVTIWNPQSAGGAISQGATAKFTLANAPSDHAFVRADGVLVTNTTAGTIATPTVVRLGTNTVPNDFWNGTISRIAIWPTTRLSNSALQNMTQASWAANDNQPEAPTMFAQDVPKRQIWAVQ